MTFLSADTQEDAESRAAGLTVSKMLGILEVG